MTYIVLITTRVNRQKEKILTERRIFFVGFNFKDKKKLLNRKKEGSNKQFYHLLKIFCKYFYYKKINFLLTTIRLMYHIKCTKTFSML
jgi:Golgi nucleoside diphosphatase